jgi:ribose transport system permease protein
MTDGASSQARRFRSPAAGVDLKRFILVFLSSYGTILVLIALCLLFAVSKGSLFFGFANVINILQGIAIGGVISIGLTLPLSAGDFDLSIGYVASFSGVLATGLMAEYGFPVWAAVVCTIVACAIFGAVNGLLVAKANIHSLIATLGTGTILGGLTYLFSSGAPVVSGIPTVFIEISRVTVANVPVIVLVFLGVALSGWLFLNKFVLGHNVRAVGGNAEAARYAGIRVARARITALSVCAACAGAGGVILASKLGSAQLAAGNGYLLDSFAAVFLGSVALRHGEFHIVGTVIGVVTIGVGENGLALLGIASFWGQVFSGGLLIAAVGVASVARLLARQ